MKHPVTLLSVVCLLALASVAGASPAPTTVEEAPAPTQQELLEDLFGAAHDVSSCTIVGCGNTGDHFGYGSSCQAAQYDLRAALDATAETICSPGAVSSIQINYGSCTMVARGEYRYSGNGDVFCKLCNGQACALYS